MHSFILNFTLHKIHVAATNSYTAIWTMLTFCEFDTLRGERKISRTEWQTFCCSSKGKRSGHQRSDQKTHMLLASWTVRAESLGILKEWIRRRYQGWSRWRRSPRKLWWEGYQNLKSLLSTIEVNVLTSGRPHGQKQGTKECAMGPSLQETPKELRRNRGRGRSRTWPPQWRSPTGSALSGQDCRLQ